MIAFETMGNATLVVHDHEPVLCTDPWIEGEAYFGSWAHRFAIPAEQLESIKGCEFVWFSHGHPDHLNAGSLEHFRNRKVLLPDHVGGRIRDDLVSQGFNVHVLATRKWYRLSEHIHVLCLPDYNQDATLLVNINGRLLMNLNDSSHRDWTAFIRRTARQFERSFLLRLINHGDADMMNFFDETGQRTVPPRIKSVPLGVKIRASLRATGAKYYVPFSTFHMYQRTDSAWANSYVVLSPAELLDGFDDDQDKILPANLHYDCETDEYKCLNAPAMPQTLHPPEAFGDSWTDELDTDEQRRAREYFASIQPLRRNIDFIRLVVGGKETLIELSRRNFKAGITFEAPRHSLMQSIQWEVFDDLLIGNYMRTTLHGLKSLYPGFSPIVPKYADNGRAKTDAQLRQYWREYQRRNAIAMLKHQFELSTVHRIRNLVLSSDRATRIASRIYRRFSRPTARLKPSS